MGFHSQLWVFTDSHGLLMAIIGLMLFSCIHVHLIHFFHYRSIRIYTHVLLVPDINHLKLLRCLIFLKHY